MLKPTDKVLNLLTPHIGLGQFERHEATKSRLFRREPGARSIVVTLKQFQRATENSRGTHEAIRFFRVEFALLLPPRQRPGRNLVSSDSALVDRLVLR